MEDWDFADERDLQGWRCLHDVPTLRLWSRLALPYGGELQPQVEAAAARAAPKEALQALGSKARKRIWAGLLR